MKQLDTKFELKETKFPPIAEWFETGHVPLRKYSVRCHDVFGVMVQ